MNCLVETRSCTQLIDEVTQFRSLVLLSVLCPRNPLVSISCFLDALN